MLTTITCPLHPPSLVATSLAIVALTASILKVPITDTSVWGGSSADTTNDGADYVTFATSTTNAYVAAECWCRHPFCIWFSDPVHPLGWCRRRLYLTEGSSQSEIDGQAGNDSLNFAVGTYAQSTIRGGAGVTRFTDSGAVTLSDNTSILGGDGADTVAFD